MDRKQTMIILQKIPTPLSTSLSPQPHCLAIKKGISLWNNLACMVAAAACRHRPSPCLHPFRPPVTTILYSSSPYLSSFIFSMTFSRYQFSDKILEISLVFTHGITPAWVNHNRCFVKKMHLDVPCNARASC